MSFTEGLRNIFHFAQAPHENITQTGTSWQQIGGQHIQPHDTYDNLFPYVNAISQRFSTIIPYAVDTTGTEITPAPKAISALYAPNDMLSSLEFLKAICTSLLTQSHVDILIWADGKPGGTITRDNITGYTLLPQNARVYASDRSDWYYQTTMMVDGYQRTVNFTRNETISLSYSLHPEDLSRGISPAMTVKKWATVDDMIADYEAGFFGNGAVPAGMLGIVSQDAQDFQKNRDRLETAFRGAGRNNGLVYNMIPVDPITRQPSTSSKLVWTPFQQSNDTLDLSTVNEVVNNRLANALAVPDIIRGIDNGQTYANAQQAERAFIENTLKPLCMTVWDKWQFELDRITGGLGYGITFDLDLPSQTDVEKVQAETQQIKINSLLALVDAGADVDTVVDVLGLPEAYKRLRFGEDAPVLKSSTFKRSFSDADEFAEATRTFVQTVQASVQEPIDVDQAENEWVDITIDLLVALLLLQGNKIGVQLAEQLPEIAGQKPELFDWDKLPENVAEELKTSLKQTIHQSTQTITSDTIRILNQASEEKWTNEKLKSVLAEKANIKTDVIVDVVKQAAGQQAALMMAQQVAAEANVRLVKKWHSNLDDKTCSFCKGMNDTILPVDEAFLVKDASKEFDGKTFVNNWQDMQAADAHPHCRCWLSFELVKED